MAIDVTLFNFIINSYNRKVFSNLKNVLDLGDQDLAVPSSYVRNKLKIHNIKYDESIFVNENLKKPRIQSSMLWQIHHPIKCHLQFAVQHFYDLKLRVHKFLMDQIV